MTIPPGYYAETFTLTLLQLWKEAVADLSHNIDQGRMPLISTFLDTLDEEQLRQLAVDLLRINYETEKRLP